MKGMMDFLEKAGLVKRDEPEVPVTPVEDAVRAPEPEASVQAASAPSAAAKALPLDLDAIYADAGIAPSVYPAERLLRLLDGLGAMDEATRLIAIRAMDAADESWSIDDPLADAAAKVRALDGHAQGLQRDLQRLDAETQARLAAIAGRQEQVVGDIRRQITELEALIARELQRSAQETAAQQAQLEAARQHTAGQLETLAQTRRRLQGLASQFGAPAAERKE